MPDKLTVRLSGKLKRVSIPGARPAPAAAAEQAETQAESADRDTLLKEAYQDGYNRAAREWASRLNEVLKSLDLEASRLNVCRQEFMVSLEKNVIDLGIAVAEKFLISERDRRLYSINAIVNDVIEKMDTKGSRLSIALNPDDWASFDEQAGVEAKELFQSIRIVADPTVPLAGCRLDTGLGRVAFSLEEQIEEIRHLLMEAEIPERDTDEDGPQELSSGGLGKEQEKARASDPEARPTATEITESAASEAEYTESEMEAPGDDGRINEPEHAETDAQKA
ncbi:MAG: FliH/SctL family protein [Planctomycetota bacterium]